MQGRLARSGSAPSSSSRSPMKLLVMRSISLLRESGIGMISGGELIASQTQRLLRFYYSIVRPLADSSISVASRLSLVSSFFALTIHQPTVFRYHGD